MNFSFCSWIVEQLSNLDSCIVLLCICFYVRFSNKTIYFPIVWSNSLCFNYHWLKFLFVLNSTKYTFCCFIFESKLKLSFIFETKKSCCFQLYVNSAHQMKTFLWYLAGSAIIEVYFPENSDFVESKQFVFVSLCLCVMFYFPFSHSYFKICRFCLICKVEFFKLKRFIGFLWGKGSKPQIETFK